LIKKDPESPSTMNSSPIWWCYSTCPPTTTNLGDVVLDPTPGTGKMTAVPTATKGEGKGPGPVPGIGPVATPTPSSLGRATTLMLPKATNPTHLANNNHSATTTTHKLLPKTTVRAIAVGATMEGVAPITGEPTTKVIVVQAVATGVGAEAMAPTSAKEQGTYSTPCPPFANS
jgi:hypothetical protein